MSSLFPSDPGQHLQGRPPEPFPARRGLEHTARVPEALHTGGVRAGSNYRVRVPDGQEDDWEGT